MKELVDKKELRYIGVNANGVIEAESHESHVHLEQEPVEHQLTALPPRRPALESLISFAELESNNMHSTKSHQLQLLNQMIYQRWHLSTWWYRQMNR